MSVDEMEYDKVDKFLIGLCVLLTLCNISWQMGRSHGVNESLQAVERVCKAVK